MRVNSISKCFSFVTDPFLLLFTLFTTGSGCVVAAEDTASKVSIGVPVVFTEQVLLECNFVDTGAQVLHNGAQIDFGVFQAGSSSW